jgi:chromate transporter
VHEVGVTTTDLRGTPTEVFFAFLKLGVTSFGGPVAHIGYFRDELVSKRQWVSESAYADLVALCQFLPGPASSQLGFALGLQRAGALGALAAWTAFTLPSAILLILFALGSASLEGPVSQGVLHGLKLVAVAVVAQAVYGMAKSLTPDFPRIGIAAAAIALVVMIGGSFGQIAAITLGAALGLAVCRRLGAKAADALPLVSKRVGVVALVGFFVLLLGLPLIAGVNEGVALFDAFYSAGALVFGGGHVVLPLLDAETVKAGWVSKEAFIAGYGATQAVPGPLFTFAAYLGALSHGVWGAAIALVAIFVPGMLLLIGVLPFWGMLATKPQARAMMAGANAAVVGLLAAALYDPVLTSAIGSWLDLALALGGFVLLVFAKVPSWMVVLGLALLSGGVALI